MHLPCNSRTFKHQLSRVTINLKTTNFDIVHQLFCLNDNCTTCCSRICVMFNCFSLLDRNFPFIKFNPTPWRILGIYLLIRTEFIDWNLLISTRIIKKTPKYYAIEVICINSLLVMCFKNKILNWNL